MNEELITYRVDPFEIHELTPTTSVRNNQAYVLAKVVASLYRKPGERRHFGGEALLKIEDQYRVNFRLVMTADSIRFYLLTPTEKASEILRKAEAVYDANITIEKVPGLPTIDPAKCVCVEVGQRKHSIFSLDTDRSHNYPLPSLLTAVRSLDQGDIAILDVLLEPYDRLAWYREARKAHSLLERGYMPTKQGSFNSVLRGVNDVFNSLRLGIGRATRFTKDQQAAFDQYIKEERAQREAGIMLAEMRPQTKRKQGEDVVAASIRIAVQSDSRERARGAAYALANGWKDISGDNELDRYDVPEKWNAKYVERIEQRRPFSIRFQQDLYSVEEAGKMLQLPGRELIQEFPQINARKVKDTQLPEELTQADIKAVDIGTVTERGVRRKVRIPLEAFAGVPLKAVYDALCTTSFAQGKQGSGKTVMGMVWAYYFVLSGFSAILIDTADGQVLRDFINALPADYPDEKIHVLNFDNKAWPIPADWADVYGRSFNAKGDEELAALEISERITARFVGFINSLSMTGEFTDRMGQYVTSCLRAITTRKGWAFLDLELALTSPAYREELLLLAEVKAQPDVVADLNTLQARAAEGKEGEIINPILSRIKTLSATQFMANLFYQPPKFNADGSPVLDLRRLMDNPEGGYGHTIVIQASADAWQEAQATILGFFEDKINFNAFSRIDTDQASRKPVLKWIDEPHKVIKALEGRLSGTAVEFRKYRVKNLLTGHSIDQMGAAKDALLDGGAQVTSYKTERLSELQRYAHMFKPYDDAEALYEALPEKYRAVNAVRLPSGKTCPAFIADMAPPPAFVKDRNYTWQQGAEKYGRPWKQVKQEIQDKRAKYQALDRVWRAALEAAKQAAKESKKAK